jgi:hypothetical protein
MPVGTGSRKWFDYVSDDGTTYAVELDESNAESLDLGFVAATVSQPVLGQGDRGLRMRRLSCVRQDADSRSVRRQFPVGTLTAYNAALAAGSVTVSGETYQISKGFGEEAKQAVLGQDTGRIDGDNP